ncbi:MAG: hypothetical protein ACI4XA_09620 [Oscillospiraceae bacterium]
MFAKKITEITAGVIAVTGLVKAVKELWNVVGDDVKRCFDKIKSRFAARKAKRAAAAF